MFNAISNLVSGTTGVNSAQLVSDLLAASRAPKEAILREKEGRNGLAISALASATSALDTFANALKEIVGQRAFAGKPVASDPNAVQAQFVDGQRPQGLPVQMIVDQLASAQVLVSAAQAAPSTALGAGTMTITTGGGSVDVTLASGADSLSDLVAGINASGAGVTASLLTDKDGTRLLLKGATGAGEDFSIGGDFSAFNYPAGGNMTLNSSPADAQIRVDGVTLRYSGNTVLGAIPGVSLQLLKADPAATVTIAGDEPPSSPRQLLTDFVDAYNQLRSALNNAVAPGTAGGNAGPLASDNGAREMVRSLARITSASLSDTGAYRTLSSLGIRTERDGTLTLDSTRLDAIIAADPDAVGELLDPAIPSATQPGISGILNDIRDRLKASDGPLEISQKRYNAAREDLVRLRSRLDEDSARYETQLQQTYARMDGRLAALQATQAYLTQQIAAWNSTNS